MSWLEKVGKVVEKTKESSKKFMTEKGIENEKSKEIKRIKSDVLNQLSKIELENLYKRSPQFQARAIASKFVDIKQTSPSKMSKLELVEKLTGLSSGTIEEFMRNLGYRDRADKFRNEMHVIEQKYGREIEKVESGVTNEGGEDVEYKVNRIANIFLGLSKQFPNDLRGETQFQEWVEKHLQTVKLTYNQDPSTTGLFDFTRESETSFTTHERIDIMVIFDKLKIGVEMKVHLDDPSYLERLLGQIDIYKRACDAMIVWIVSDNFSGTDIHRLQEKSLEKKMIMKIVTPSGIY